MPPADFLNSIWTLGHIQRSFALYVGSDERTVRRWARGEQDIPRWVPVLLGLMVPKMQAAQQNAG